MNIDLSESKCSCISGWSFFFTFINYALVGDRQKEWKGRERREKEKEEKTFEAKEEEVEQGGRENALKIRIKGKRGGL